MRNPALRDSSAIPSKELDVLQIGHPCGLCNRLDVIATGSMLAREQGREGIELLWPLNGHMPVRFHDLFTDLPDGRVVERDIDPGVVESYCAAQAGLPAAYRSSATYGEMLNRVLNSAVPEVRAQVLEFEARHFGPGKRSRPPVGVHVRRSESPLPLCPYAQPLRYYEAVMRSLPDDTRFFVSTDSQDGFQWLQKRFGARVFQRTKAHDNRSDVSGVQEGLVDMLLLSRCSAIIGTHGSSFSGTAALAGRIPILMVKTFPRLPAEWPSFSVMRWTWAYRHFLVESTFWKRWVDWSVRPAVTRLSRAPARCWRIASTYGVATFATVRGRSRRI
jgi:hypothetical protein